MADLLAGSSGGSKKTSSKDTKKATKQLDSAVKRLKASSEQQSAQQLGYADTGSQTYSEQKQNRAMNPFASAGLTALRVLGRPGQAVMQGLQQYSGVGREEGAIAALLRTDDAIKASGRALTDISGKGDIDSFEMIGKESPGGVAAAVADLGTQIVLDPTTYLGGLGFLNRGKGALKVIKAVHGEEVAEQVAKKGYKSLDAATQAAVRTTLEGSEDALRARGDNALVGAYRNVTGRQAREGAEKYVESMIGKAGGRAQVGELVSAQGLKFLGHTIAPGVSIGNAARVTGLSNAAAAVGETALGGVLKRGGQLAADSFKPRASVARAAGQETADVLGLTQKAARSLEYRLNDADIARVRAALGRSTLKPEALKIIDNALDTGRVDKAVSHFAKSGDQAAIRTLKALDSVRSKAGDRMVRAGLAEADQLHNTDSYLYRRLTPQAEKWIAENESKAAQILGYKPTEANTGLLKDAGPKFRKLDPDAAASDLNKRLAAETGIPNFFSTDPIERVLSRSTQINHETAIASLLDDLTRVTDEAGNPLMIPGVDRVKDIKALDAALRDSLRPLDKEIGKLTKAVAQENTREAVRRTALKSLDSSIRTVERQIDKYGALVGRHTGRTIAAGTDARAAADAGRAAAGAAPKLPSAQDVRRELAEVLSDPTLPDDVKAALRAEYAAAQKAGAWERSILRSQRGSEAARAAGKSVQQRVGATRAAAKYENILRRAAEQQLSGAQREFDRLTARRSKIAEALPSSLPRLQELQAERTGLKTATKASKQALAAEQRAFKERIRTMGYTEVPAGPLGSFYGPQEIAKEITKVGGMLQDDEALKVFGTVVGGATQAWKNLALNTVVLGTGTSARNAVGNLMLMWQGGFSDPSMFRPAGKAVRAMRRATKGGQSIATAVSDPKLTSWERWGLRNAIRLGVVGGGFNRTDLAKTAIAATPKQKLVQAVDLRKPESILTRHMSKANEEIEDVSRMAMYFDELRKTGNPRVAAQNTQRALIDYQDLTNVERKIKLLVPFYTFMSRNLALQAYALGHTPGKVLQIDRLRNAIFDREDEVDTNGVPIPDYMLKTGQTPFLSVGGTPLLSTMQTPLDAAGQVVQPLFDVASVAPGVPNQYATEGGSQGAAAGLLQNIGGAPGSLGKYAASEATGVDIGTGAPLKENESTKRLLNALIPIIGRTENTTGDLTGDDEARRVARILSTLGITTGAVDDRRANSEIYRRIRESGSSAKRQNIPTLTAQKAAKKKPTPKKKES